ncbi:cell division cycle protein 20 homolog B isoform X2 [Cynoglossus semilaevis]|uniref:cell division cycle protein 20 homolog B isoform X2 n=1 Tax=Cynoglossus semilaevis TaxID=244447 RepID=UPI0007DCAB09|nr:cell division cycle protein 20 homolog B isoform X2 [Cynoglossus semilaevis]
MRDLFRNHVGTRGRGLFQGLTDAPQTSYKRFRRRLVCRERSSSNPPAVSTPLTTGWRCGSGFELDTVRQRLQLDSPPSFKDRGSAEQRDLQEFLTEASKERNGMKTPTVMPEEIPHDVIISCPSDKNVTQQGWIWRAAAQEDDDEQRTGREQKGFKQRKSDLLPFTVLNQTSVKRLAAPSLRNDFYTDVLDCSCNGMVALALGSTVHLWNSETQVGMGNLGPSPQSVPRHQQSVSCLRWSRDGRTLCIGIKSGEIVLWDVERRQKTRHVSSHSSEVGAVSWKQQLLSSASVLGWIHHFDPRAPGPLIGAALQTERVCSLQWSPAEDQLASGSTGGLLHIWDDDISGEASSKKPVLTMKQPTAVKAMAWCPWRGNTIATGGGWKDGKLRIWDTNAGTCVTAVTTDSQICSLQWAEQKRHVVTGHGLPHHQVTCWTWESDSLRSVQQFKGQRSFTSSPSLGHESRP